jgi:hypothetical protein
MAITACVSVRRMGARNPVTRNIGSCSALVRYGRPSAPSPSIVAQSLPAEDQSAPHAYSAPAIHIQIAVPPFLH